MTRVTRTCKRCNQPCQQGVHFTIRLLHQAAIPAEHYDVCKRCFDVRRPLIIPAALRRPGVVQYDVQYEPFGMGGAA